MWRKMSLGIGSIWIPLNHSLFTQEWQIYTPECNNREGMKNIHQKAFDNAIQLLNAITEKNTKKGMENIHQKAFDKVKRHPMKNDNDETMNFL